MKSFSIYENQTRISLLIIKSRDTSNGIIGHFLASLFADSIPFPYDIPWSQLAVFKSKVCVTSEGFLAVIICDHHYKTMADRLKTVLGHIQSPKLPGNVCVSFVATNSSINIALHRFFFFLSFQKLQYNIVCHMIHLPNMVLISLYTLSILFCIGNQILCSITR